MAKATKQPADYTLTLELSRYEAEVLRFVCRSIAGSPSDSPRRATDEIQRALQEAGVPIVSYGVSGRFSFDGDEK